MTLRSAARSLAQLDQYFHRVATATERMRFVRCYLESRRTIARDAKPMPPVRAILNAVQAASTSHNERLVHQRDRRLRSRGAYFSAFDLGGGWRVTVVLKLERRHLFPEPGVPDRTESDWRRLLEPFLRSAGTESRDFDAATSEVCIGDGVRVEVSKSTGWAGRLAWTTTGSPHRRAFEHCHTMRHRDLNSPLVLGVMEHGNQILIDCSVLLMADPADD